jgi:hypothetical protein
MINRLLRAGLCGIPAGRAVRQSAGLMLLGLGLVRALGIGYDRALLTFLPLAVYGWGSTLVGASLLATVRWRLRPWGRVVAVNAFAFCIAIGADFWPSGTGMLIYGLWALLLIVEATGSSANGA